MKAFATPVSMALLLMAGPVMAQAPVPVASAPVAKSSAPALCDACGTVTQVHEETRKGKGGALGIVGGAVVGGLLGNQVGGGTGKTLATAGGAAGGAYLGNEIQKKVNSKKVWITSVRLKDGSTRSFEQEAQPAWGVGQVVLVNGNALTKQ